MATDAAPTTAGLGRALREARDEIVDAILERRGEIPAYARESGHALDDLRADVAGLIDALCDALEHGRPLDRDDVAFLREPIAHRGRRGDSLADIGLGLRLLQGVVYERVGELDDGDPRAALAVGARLLELIDVATIVAGEAWTDARAGDAQPGDRDELLEALLDGREPERASQRELAGRLGHVPGAGVLAVVARTARADASRGSPAAALGAMSRAGAPPELPLASAREDELVVLRAAPDEDVTALVSALERAWRRLADRGLRLAVGISARHTLPDGARSALAEARVARDTLPAGGGIVALPSLGPLDWMTLRADTTTWELVPPKVRTFLEQDAQDGGTLLATFRGYVASDLNVKLAGRRLHMHTNTARYRLGRIAERTGLDMRSFEDVATLYVAARLFECK
jgi:PucR C-terminal helix-turn-helix domain/GGDEF-like domain